MSPFFFDFFVVLVGVRVFLGHFLLSSQRIVHHEQQVADRVVVFEVERDESYHDILIEHGRESCVETNKFRCCKLLQLLCKDIRVWVRELFEVLFVLDASKVHL